MKNNLDLIHQQSKEASKLLKIMAHADRMVVLCLLSSSEMNVTNLREHSQLSQSAFSQHLSVLRKNNIVKVRKEAQHVFYSLADERIRLILNALQKAFCPDI
ncbi:ArsR family transcriptional regulator [Psychromonas sp. PRT-SC03]|nr:ArsR family transcriptional regulator [Psychromonas sp. PRT-SC03]